MKAKKETKAQVWQREENVRLERDKETRVAYQLAELIGQQLTKILKPILEKQPEEKARVRNYSFGIDKTLELGIQRNLRLCGSPKECMTRITRIVMNAPCFGMFVVSRVELAGQRVLIGGSEDAFFYSAMTSTNLELPGLTEFQDAEVEAEYNGMCPSPFSMGMKFLFVVRFSGEASF